jgi:hypothetical protein
MLCTSSGQLVCDRAITGAWTEFPKCFYYNTSMARARSFIELWDLEAYENIMLREILQKFLLGH